MGKLIGFADKCKELLRIRVMDLMCLYMKGENFQKEGSVKQ